MAFKGTGAILSASSAAAAGVNITGVSKAKPAVITATNTFADGDVVVVTDVGGMTELNDRAFMVDTASGTSFDLKGEDSTDYDTYTSGGTAAKQTMQAIGQVSTVSGFDGQSAEIDVSHLGSQAKEFVLGLQDFGQVTLKVFLDNSDVGQALLRTIKRSQAPTAFSLKLADGTTAAFMALVKQFSFDGVAVDGAVSGNVTLRVTNEPAWFA